MSDALKYYSKIFDWISIFKYEYCHLRAVVGELSLHWHMNHFQCYNFDAVFRFFSVSICKRNAIFSFSWEPMAAWAKENKNTIIDNENNSKTRLALPFVWALQWCMRVCRYFPSSNHQQPFFLSTRQQSVAISFVFQWRKKTVTQSVSERHSHTYIL